jgi:chromosome partitioning protein
VAEEELVGVSEAADMLGVTRQTVANWRTRRPDFPAPIAELRSGPIWNRSKVLEWAGENEIELATSESPASSESGEMVTVAVVNMKGGVGKSTLTANLGWFCAYRKNQRVLLVDLDPQFNLSQYVMGTAGYENHVQSGKGTVLNVFEQVTPPSISGTTGKKRKLLRPKDVIAPVRKWTDGSKIDLLPSTLELSWTLKNPHSKEHLLADLLNTVRNDYDLVLIDCPPTESMLTTAAYLASDSVLVPVKPEYLSTIGLPLVVKSLEEFENTYKNHSIDVLGIVFNAAGDKLEHDRSRADVQQVAKDYGWYVFKNEISYSDSYPKGSRQGRPIFLTDYARSTKIADFYNVANEFLKRAAA